MGYDVFISFKKSASAGKGTTVESSVAGDLYKVLRSKSINAFYSEESLAECGAGQFSRAIEKALEEARVFVLVGSCRENIESRYVEAEWDSFLNDVRSGHKDGHLFILNCGKMKPSELPLFLRRQQMFPESELPRLVQFIESALPSPATLDDLIHSSLHCLRPEKNEDKIYLWTAHRGPQNSGFIVTAHWGPRLAKRLNSQIKGTGLGDEQAVSSLVESEKRQKLKDGYKVKSHSRLLTAEAKAFLCAALGVEAPKTKVTRKLPKAPGRTASKNARKDKRVKK